MTKLRAKTKNEIQEALENTYFTAGSFDVKYHEDEDADAFLEVIFIPQPEFVYKAIKSTRYSSSRDGTWQTLQAPGVHLREAESFSTNNFNEIIEALPEWSSRILEDYRHSKDEVLDEFQEFQKQVDIKVKETNKDKTERFASDEANSLRDTLDTLYVKFENLSKDNDELKAQLSAIKKQIENMKGDVEVFPKNAWYRISGSKIVKMMKQVATTPEGRKLIAETAKKYLLGS